MLLSITSSGLVSGSAFRSCLTTDSASAPTAAYSAGPTSSKQTTFSRTLQNAAPMNCSFQLVSVFQPAFQKFLQTNILHINQLPKSPIQPPPAQERCDTSPHDSLFRTVFPALCSRRFLPVSSPVNLPHLPKKSTPPSPFSLHPAAINPTVHVVFGYGG